MRDKQDVLQINQERQGGKKVGRSVETEKEVVGLGQKQKKKEDRGVQKRERKKPCTEGWVRRQWGKVGFCF